MITTPRLLLRPWRETDLDAMATINANTEVMRYFPATQDRSATAAFIRRQHLQQEEFGYCYFAAELRHSEQLIGFLGLNCQEYPAPFTPATDIGWRLHPDFWRQGLATEGAAACLDYAFQVLDLKKVIAVAVAQNLPSLGVMQKIGMKPCGEFLHPALQNYPSLQRCVWYEALQSIHRALGAGAGAK